MNKNEWDQVITTKTKIFSFDYKLIWKYKDLLYLLVRRDFVAFYKQTILGPIWFFIQPIFTTVVYFYIFNKIASISTDGIPPLLFYMTGIASWNYYSDCLLKTSSVFRDNSNIFGKVYFPRIIIPLSIIFSGLFKLIIQLILLFIVILYYKYTSFNFSFSINVILLPVLIILMALQGLGFGMLISAMTTKYRDLAILLNFGIQLLMYTTTIAYPLSSLKGYFKLIISLNPPTYIIEGVRKSIFGIGEFSLLSFIYILFITIIILILGLISFNNVEKNFVDTI